MNLPDVTLLLQIANFTIAYIIMRKLIFAPVLKILQQQDLYKQSLLLTIDQAKKEQHLTMIKQKTAWQKAKESLYAIIPKLSPVCVTTRQLTDISLQEPNPLSAQDKKALIEKLSDQLSDVKL